jgi:hypothetical protein
MLKWEYCVIEISQDGEAKVIYISPPGEKHRAEAIEEIYQALAQLGLEGWELVTHTLTGVTEYYTLKRPCSGVEDES